MDLFDHLDDERPAPKRRTLSVSYLTAAIKATLEDTFGVLRLTLHGNSYDWSFVRAAGDPFSDSGSQACH